MPKPTKTQEAKPIPYAEQICEGCGHTRLHCECYALDGDDLPSPPEPYEDDNVDTEADEPEPPHSHNCICADCSGAELTADND